MPTPTSGAKAVILNPDGEVFQKYMVRNLPIAYIQDQMGYFAGMHREAADWNSAHAHDMIDHVLQNP